MALARSRITEQGRVSVPAEVRRKLGVGPGSILEWDEDGDKIVVRRSGRFTSEDIQRALFPKRVPNSRTIDDMKKAMGRRIEDRYAGRLFSRARTNSAPPISLKVVVSSR